jgi:Na+-transporting NADH:ubiquinone oxidoreductase subunit C
VSGAAVALEERQDANRVTDRQKKVLTVMGVKDVDTKTPQEVETLFKAKARARVIDLATGAYDDKADGATFDAKKASKDLVLGMTAPKNKAGIKRMSKKAVVYEVTEKGELSLIVLPIEGKGLWSTLYGFIAIDAKDFNTIRGITFYKHGETPGLGGEVDNPLWKSKWPDRKAFGKDGKPAIRVIKGAAPPAKEAPHKIDGLAGATITANGVTHLVQFWLGEHGFAKYLARLKKGGKA